LTARCLRNVSTDTAIPPEPMLRPQGRLQNLKTA
jgi:hypothetical protein